MTAPASPNSHTAEPVDRERELLADLGVSSESYADLQHARALIALVNRRLTTRGSALRYSLGFSLDVRRERPMPSRVSTREEPSE